ncbi:hypothetical protein QFC19_008002 [Naganishia cerealis]|uniref:Uncharacterized protein n=1 Tax=Naganishia cerealis TaxID=610337 RepID=A0ACC2V5P6_9TREE|nr:hypothetical protein QFC19_008002 [Naganishia cerealis]
MTGLDEETDVIIEIAVIITNGNLEPVDDGIEYVIKTDKEVLDKYVGSFFMPLHHEADSNRRMGEWCTKQHGESGLTASCIASPYTYQQVSDEILAYVKKWVPDERVGILAGSSVHADKRFLAKGMPELDAHLHYRIVGTFVPCSIGHVSRLDWSITHFLLSLDVSSIKELAKRWYPGDVARRAEKNKERFISHRISSKVQLPEDIRIPQLGFGVYLSPAERTTASVTHALHAGYRHIDTAQIYRNEKQVGDAVRLFLEENKNQVCRQDIWITTKLRDEKGRLPKKLDNVPQLLTESVDVICGSGEMEGYVDLFLIHSPYAGVDGRRIQWQALEDLKKAGKVRAIGVSN